VLPELLDRAPGPVYEFIAASIEDRPAMPFRGTYMAGLPRLRAERLSWCERLAALRSLVSAYPGSRGSRIGPA